MEHKLLRFVGKRVLVKCKDGRLIEGYYVEGLVPNYENYDPEEGWPDEDSILLTSSSGNGDGIGLYESEIETIEEVKE